MLGQVDVEVDGAAEDGEEVGHLAHVVHPHRPGRQGLGVRNSICEIFLVLPSPGVLVPTCWAPTSRCGTG